MFKLITEVGGPGRVPAPPRQASREIIRPGERRRPPPWEVAEGLNVSATLSAIAVSSAQKHHRAPTFGLSIGGFHS